MAHVTFTHDAESGIKFGNVVGASEDAVLATNTLVIEVSDDAGDRILFVSEYRAATCTGRIVAMVAGTGDDLSPGTVAVTTDEHLCVPPGFVGIETVEGVAGGDTGLATSAGIEINFEGILLIRTWAAQRNQIAIVTRLDRFIDSGVFLAEAGDSGERLLIFQQLIDQRKFAAGE